MPLVVDSQDRAGLLLQNSVEEIQHDAISRAWSASKRFWIAAPPDRRNISRSASARSASGYGCAPAKRTNGTISVGAAPRTVSLRAIRSSIVSSSVPSARRSARQASAMAASSARLAGAESNATNRHGRV